MTSSSSMTRLTMSAMHSIARRATIHNNKTRTTIQQHVNHHHQRRHLRATTTTVMSAYQSSKVGDYPSLDFRCFYKKDGKRISPWHDVPLKNADGSFNFICEIPKETKAKMEVATDEKLTPIKQDTKKGKLRDYPYNINWNYGMLPQTWEDPQHVHPTMNVKKPTRERNNKRRAEEKIHRERQHTFNTISTTDTKKNVYEENSGGIARRNNSAVSALCF